MATIDTWNLLINRTGTITSGVWNGTPIGVSYGGTGATSVAGAQQGLAVQKVAWRSVSSGTDTLTIADGTVEYSTSCTVTLPAGSTGIAGDTIRLVASAANVTLTIQRAGSDTIDGGTSITVALGTSRAACLVVRQTTTTAWGSVQPSGVAGTQYRLVMNVSGGVVSATIQAYVSGAWVTVKGPATISKTAGTSALGVTASGTGFNFPAGYATVADQPTEGDYWLEPLNGSGALAATWTPASDGQLIWTYDTTTTDPGTNYVQCQAYVGNTDFSSGFRIGYGRHLTTLVVHANGDNLATTTGTTCTRAGKASAIMGWVGTTAQWASARGRASSSMVTPTSTQPAAGLGTVGVALVCLRPALGGGAATLSGVEAIYYFGAGELTW